MGKKLTQKDCRTLSTTIACCGLLMIASGIFMNTTTHQPTVRKIFTLDVAEAKVSQAQTSEPKLKDMELEVNNPLSLNIKDYIENYEDIPTSVLKAYKLDTSMVNINQPGSYNYTINYKKKKYNGIFVIKAKELPKVEINVKNLSLEKGAALSTNVTTYIENELTDEMKSNIVINLRDVNTAQPGEYLYTVTYDNKLYTGKIWIYEKQTTIITPNSPSPTPTPTEDQIAE